MIMIYQTNTSYFRNMVQTLCGMKAVAMLACDSSGRIGFLVPNDISSRSDDTNDINNTNDINDNEISKEYKIDIELLKRNINKIRNRSSIKSKTEKEKEINYNEKILEQLILLNKKIDNLIMK